MKKFVKDRARFLVCVLYFIYVMVQSFCLIWSGDDFPWFGMSSFREFLARDLFNGRYLTNVLNYTATHNSVLLIVMYIFVHYMLFYQTAKLISHGRRNSWAAYVFVAVGMLSVPQAIYRQTTSWISGFTCYYFAAMFTVMYLNLCLASLHDTQKKTGFLTYAYAFVIGFLGALCLETATMLNLILVSVFLAECLIRRKKLPAVHIVYFVSTAVGAVCMFLNRNYASLAEGNMDEFGYRTIEFSFIEMMTKVYREFIRLYIRPYAFLNIVIAAALVFLYFRTYNTENRKRPKYGKVAMLFVLCYASYSVVSEYFNFYTLTDVQYRMQSIETALMFLYLLAVLYLVWHLTAQKTFHTFAMCWGASVLSMLPFLLVEPLTPRCFFCGYIYWMLTAGVLWSEVYRYAKQSKRLISAAKPAAVIGAGVYLGIVSYMLIVNKYCDTVRIRYIHEQLDAHRPVVEVIALPFQTLQTDYLSSFLNVYANDSGDSPVYENSDGASDSDDTPLYSNPSLYNRPFSLFYGFPEDMRDETKFLSVTLYSYTMDSHDAK